MNKQNVDVVESRVTARLLSLSTYFIAVCLVLFIAWSVFTKVDEIAKAKGAVIPEGDRQIIQSETGGRLKSILVSEGELVEKGQTLVEFDSKFQNTALDELNAQRAALELTIERLNSLVEIRDPDFSQYADFYPRQVSQQLKQLAAEKELFFQKRSTVIKEQAQVAAELEGLQTELPVYQRQLNATKQELDILIKGQKAGNISKLRVLEMKQKLASIEKEIQQAKNQENVLKRKAETVGAQLKQIGAEARVQANIERSKAEADLSGLRARIRSGKEKVLDTVVKSPVKGLVQSIPSTQNGGVIVPGGTIAEIVPVEGKASFKARLSPRDIGFVSIGQPARIKVDAFDYSRFGALKGEIEKISPTTSKNERGDIYYEVTVSIEKSYFRDNPDAFSLLPGMTGEVDITTGEKSVFQYLWKPIYTNVSRAFGER
ncbi:HlyD family type I secretion periplasmic adaptor subunit [Aliivibrio sifiae]|uniref:Membrane fusion protein (MFP) family protein n=1 Tax=Aliivibrio sifiae TaxID=566293 RepID=A0A2S7XHP3_9GAMM|nr:HlyD family type I secretion periplasmic adaptor subunit [Aliivibrio sifiae]PQJ93229.1 secretion protein HylD [Aliivibrio sifiae]GLR76066.1 HlyD family type I secretion periplasmic adaptor subunit [Aliivibrio sifiae]